MFNLSNLKTHLDGKYGEAWLDYEVETIASEEPGVTIDQLEVLKSIEQNPRLILEDVLFFLHAVDVMNHNKVDFSTVPFPTSLELAWAIKEMNDIFGDASVLIPHSSVVSNVVKYVLKHEGYTHPTKYFQEFISEGDGFDGPPEVKKEKGISLYIDGMNSYETA